MFTNAMVAHWRCCLCSRKPGDMVPLSFYRFPKDEELSNKWATEIGEPHIKEKSVDVRYKNLRVCSAHFDFRMFSHHIVGCRLKKNAIPTIFERDEVPAKRAKMVQPSTLQVSSESALISNLTSTSIGDEPKKCEIKCETVLKVEPLEEPLSEEFAINKCESKIKLEPLDEEFEVKGCENKLTLEQLEVLPLKQKFLNVQSLKKKLHRKLGKGIEDQENIIPEQFLNMEIGAEMEVGGPETEKIVLDFTDRNNNGREDDHDYSRRSSQALMSKKKKVSVQTSAKLSSDTLWQQQDPAVVEPLKRKLDENIEQGSSSGKPIWSEPFCYFDIGAEVELGEPGTEEVIDFTDSGDLGNMEDDHSYCRRRWPSQALILKKKQTIQTSAQLTSNIPGQPQNPTTAERLTMIFDKLLVVMEEQAKKSSGKRAVVANHNTETPEQIFDGDIGAEVEIGSLETEEIRLDFTDVEDQGNMEGDHSYLKRSRPPPEVIVEKKNVAVQTLAKLIINTSRSREKSNEQVGTSAGKSAVSPGQNSITAEQFFDFANTHFEKSVFEYIQTQYNLGQKQPKRRQ